MSLPLTLSPDGSTLYAGYNRHLKIWDINRPGRNYRQINYKGKGLSIERGFGIISCLAVNPTMPSLYAAASYTKIIGLGMVDSDNLLCTLSGHVGGVTHLAFSPDGTKLYSGARKDNEILCWDLRQPGAVLYSLHRTVDTNQRIYFSIDNTGNYLASGGTDGSVNVWYIGGGQPQHLYQFTAHQDCTNGVSFHPDIPVLATSCGQRHFPEPTADEDEHMFTMRGVHEENAVNLYTCGVRVS